MYPSAQKNILVHVLHVPKGYSQNQRSKMTLSIFLNEPYNATSSILLPLRQRFITHLLMVNRCRALKGCKQITSLWLHVAISWPTHRVRCVNVVLLMLHHCELIKIQPRFPLTKEARIPPQIPKATNWKKHTNNL